MRDKGRSADDRLYCFRRGGDTERRANSEPERRIPTFRLGGSRPRSWVNDGWCGLTTISARGRSKYLRETGDKGGEKFPGLSIRIKSRERLGRRSGIRLWLLVPYDEAADNIVSGLSRSARSRKYVD